MYAWFLLPNCTASVTTCLCQIPRTDPDLHSPPLVEKEIRANSCGGGCAERLENILADEKCFKILSQIPKTALGSP